MKKIMISKMIKIRSFNDLLRLNDKNSILEIVSDIEFPDIESSSVNKYEKILNSLPLFMNSSFQGEIHGNNHEIRNLNLEKLNRISLFYDIKNSKISDLIFRNCRLVSKYSQACLLTSSSENSNFSNISIYDSVIISQEPASIFACNLTNSVIEKCQIYNCNIESVNLANVICTYAKQSIIRNVEVKNCSLKAILGESSIISSRLYELSSVENCTIESCQIQAGIVSSVVCSFLFERSCITNLFVKDIAIKSNIVSCNLTTTNRGLIQNCKIINSVYSTSDPHYLLLQTNEGIVDDCLIISKSNTTNETRVIDLSNGYINNCFIINLANKNIRLPSSNYFTNSCLLLPSIKKCKIML